LSCATPFPYTTLFRSCPPSCPPAFRSVMQDGFGVTVTRPKKVRMTSLKILTKASVLVYKNFKYTSSAQKSHKELTLIHENSKTPQICGLPPFAKHRGRPIAGPGPAHSRRRFIARFGDRLDHGRIPGHRRGCGGSQRQPATV